MSGFAAVSWVFLGLGILTGLVILADIIRHPQPMSVMNATWPITGLYFPIVGIWIYWRMGRSTRGGGHQHGHGHHHGHGDKPLWQGVFVSTTHCGGGCTLGDSIAAPLVTALGFTVAGSVLLGHFVGEFIAAYLVGVLFQFLPIMGMGNRSPGRALIDAIKADTLSLVAFEIGMFGWMAIATYAFLGGEPSVDSAVFWFMMQIAMVLGFATSYPANWWLVRRGVKHAM